MISPFLNVEKLKSDTNISEKEMYALIMSNLEDLKKFGKNISFVKENQKYLDFNPVLDSEDKIKKIRPFEVQSMDMETKVLQMSENVDNLLKNYNETVNIINQKFAIYNNLLNNI
jgi:hypothetical protein